MATAMIMRWPGVSLDDYDEALVKVRWEEELPDGALFHIACHDGEALRITDIWESADHFQRFAEERLMPVVKGEMNLPGEPEVTLCEVHRMFAAKEIPSGAGLLV